jgi:hypothetical protein
MAKKEAPAYPDKTKGSQTAAKARTACNAMSDVQREDSFNRGMALIYGRGHKQAARAGH